MALVNRYDKTAFGKKFRRYKIFCLLSYGVFFLSVILEMILYGSGGEGALLLPISWREVFVPIATGEALLYLLTFLLGVTVYAPALAFLSSALRGMLCGYVVSCVFSSLSGKESVLLLLLVGVYFLVSASLSCCYASFCAMVSLRIYTDGILRNVKKEEKRMFGGTLFNSTFFCNTINLRFLSAYTILYLAVFLISIVICFAFAHLRSMLC